jgi:hypothetical protein
MISEYVYIHVVAIYMKLCSISIYETILYRGVFSKKV